MIASHRHKLALLAFLATAAMMALLPLSGALGAPTAARVAVLPSSTTIRPTGTLTGAKAISLNAAIGEREAAWILVSGARQIAGSIDTKALHGLPAGLSWGHYVRFSPGVDVPDALLPWDGTARPAERPNQPIYFQVAVPYGAKPGLYHTTVTVTADGKPTAVPVSIRVFPFKLPLSSSTKGNLATAFLVSGETYVKKTAELYHFTNNGQRSAANALLYMFLANYRISPAKWGYGEPKSKAGYEQSAKWWLDSAGNMVKEASANGGISAMRIPVSSNRTSAGTVIAGLSPSEPQTWCPYLRAVRSFWQQHGWLSRLPYLYTTDEPGLTQMKLVAQQAKVGHTCFPGSKMLVTGNPSAANRFVWDNKNGDDVDIWAVLSRRYYGQFTNPGAKVNRARANLALVNAARKAHKTIWSYTYSAVAGSPGYAAIEPLSDPRMLQLWNAFEGLTGMLYTDGITTYTTGNPLQSVANGGISVLLYPGPAGPIPSARLEQLRDGIEDWAIFNAVRAKRGAGAVRAILTSAGLFSGTAQGAKLACHLGCELKSSTKYSWPFWSHDATTSGRIEKAHLAALTLAR
jgi:hypothetical protein